MKHPKFWCILGLASLTSLVTIGFEAGQDQKKPAPTPTTVTSPPEVVDPARQALVEQLKKYRRIGDRAGEAAIWQLLDPGLTYMPSKSPSDIIVTPAIEGSSGFQVQWQTSDIVVSNNSMAHETHPAIDFLRSGPQFPNVLVACELWDGPSAKDKILVTKSSDHGLSWTPSFIFDDPQALAAPQIKQTSNTHMGVVFEEWQSSSNADLWFVKMLASSPSTNPYFALIDGSAANTQKPCLTSDAEDYGDSAHVYVAYYQITYEPAVNPSWPYRYNLMFTRGSNLATTWTNPTSLAEFRSADGGIPVHGSIDYEADTLYLAYISGLGPAISVIRSMDFGSTWSSPTLLASPNSHDPEVAVGDGAHAIVAFTYKFSPTDEDPEYYYTTNGTNWTFGSLSNTVDLQNSPVVRDLGGRYYAAFRDSSFGRIYTTNADINSMSWTSKINVKNSANAVSVSPGAVNLIAKPGPWGVVGSAAIWAEDSATADIYFDAAWLGSAAVREDLLGTWDGQGTYFRNSETGAWTCLTSPADLVACGDLSGDGKDEVVGVWSGAVWIKNSADGSWVCLTTAPRDMTVADMNGDWRADFVGTWDGQGVFYKNSITGGWVQITGPATKIGAGDLDGDWKGDLIWAATGQGLWIKYSKTGTWTKLANSLPRDISVGDMNGDGRADLLGTWDPTLYSSEGVYYLDSVGGGWVLMTSSAEQVTAGDLDGDLTDDLLGVWPSQGIWVKYSKTGSWAQITTAARDIAAGKLTGGAWSAGSGSPLELTGPVGSYKENPGAGSYRDLRDNAPGGKSFTYRAEKNLIPQDAESHIQRVPGPGEPGFKCIRQENLFPGDRIAKKSGEKKN